MRSGRRSLRLFATDVGPESLWPPVLTLREDGRPVNWLGASPDGSAVFGWQNGGEWLVWKAWDVGGLEQGAAGVPEPGRPGDQR